MTPYNRRSFLSGSLGSFAAAVAAGPLALAADTSADTGPDTLFLTWQRDPTTTMTIQWVGDPAHDNIHFAPVAPDAVWTSATVRTKPFPLTDLRVSRCELTGLTPGSEYRFRLGSDQREFRFRTMPAKVTDTFQFVSGGDCGVNEHAIANNILAAKQDPYFILIGGDLGYDNGKSPKTMLDFLRNYSRHAVDSSGRLVPMVTCIGNHEVDGGYGKTRAEARLYLALFDGLFADTTYATLDFGDYLSLVLLDTGHAAPLAGDQTDWLDRTLRERVGLPHLLVVNHVPAYPSYRSFEESDGPKKVTGEGNRRHWVPLFEKYNVDAVLEHHDHTFKRTHPMRGGSVSRDGIVYLGDGSWGKLRSPKDPEKRPYLARIEKSYHLTVHRLEGEERFHVALSDTGRVADVCRTGKKPRHRAKG